MKIYYISTSNYKMLIYVNYQYDKKTELTKDCSENERCIFRTCAEINNYLMNIERQKGLPISWQPLLLIRDFLTAPIFVSICYISLYPYPLTNASTVLPSLHIGQSFWEYASYFGISSARNNASIRCPSTESTALNIAEMPWRMPP